MKVPFELWCNSGGRILFTNKRCNSSTLLTNRKKFVLIITKWNSGIDSSVISSKFKKSVKEYLYFYYNYYLKILEISMHDMFYNKLYVDDNNTFLRIEYEYLI